MTYVRQENYRTPTPGMGCPAFEGMENIEVGKTRNEGAIADEWYVGGLPPDPVYFAHDPENPQAGAVVLGRDYSAGDAFCQCHEAASSAVLGDVHDKIEACEGPVEVRRLFGLITRQVCGAGFKKETARVERLNRLASDRSVRVVVRSSPREPEHANEADDLA